MPALNSHVYGRRLLHIALAILGAVGIQVDAQAATSCPAYPAFPNSSCTGWQHTGVTLSAHSGSLTLSTPGAVYDTLRFNGNVTIGAANITIKRSEILGVVDNPGNHAGLLIEDTKIDGRNQSAQCVGRRPGVGIVTSGFTLRRVDLSNCTQGVYATNFTLEQSYIHDLYGSGSVHTEGILGQGPGNIVVRHNRIEGTYNSSSGPFNSDGGMSAAAVFYTHTSFWPNINGVTFEQNYLKAESSSGRQAGFCLYGGASDDDGNTSNGIFKDNVFARGASGKCASYGPVTWVATGSGSCWSNNKYEDGAVISGGNRACAASVLPNPPTSVTIQ